MLLAVAAGGAVGSALRYLVSQWMARPGGGFPAATLAVNLAGCLLLGLLTRAFAVPGSDPAWRAALTIGLCGGFTTFSTFSAELVTLVQQRHLAAAALYVVASLVGGVVAMVGGLALGQRLFLPRP